MKKRKILVVEDNAINRAMLTSLLEDDFEIIEAEDGLIGLEELERHYRDISLILLDVYMPRCDGFEFLRRKSQDERLESVPVIITTAGGSVEDEIACLELGANDFVVKPYNFEILLNRVNNLIRLRESAVIVHELTWDSVTGLYNKEFFFQACEEAFAERPDSDFDMLCSDIESFKSLNDRYGEVQCDTLLHELALRLFAEVEGIVCGGRIGPDVFALLVEDGEHAWVECLGHVTRNLPVHNATVKFGIVEHVDHEMAVPTICNRAMSAIETVKGRYGNDVALFDDELHRQQMLEQTIRDSMELALRGLQFSVFYQPKHDVKRNLCGGAEALVRWQHPTVGFISPGLFVPIFERSGFITELDLFVWKEACKEVARMKALDLPCVPISVNFSRLDFDMDDLPERIASIADRFDVEHELLHVELTETAYTDNHAVVEMLARLKEFGFSTELDDFGSGYSSLASLNTLPLDVMKLDMSMIRKATELNDFRIVESTINLAQVLGLSTVVEGVETAEEARRVSEMGADYIQGYFYSKPLTRDDFEEYLVEHH